jgi:hypothetical protein
MPAPHTPSEFLELVPSIGGTCEKFNDLMLRFPELVYDVMSYMYNEDGTFTDEFKADICGLGCMGGVPVQAGNVPKNVVASDGQFVDKVRVTWDPVAGAVEYRVFRNPSNDINAAEQIGTTTTTTFNDTTAAEGQVYYYWVKSVDSAGVISAPSTPDTGYISGTITPVSDLDAGRGYGEILAIGSSTSALGAVPLVWTPPSGETIDCWDIYVNTSASFDTASRVDIDRSPYDNKDNPYGLCPVSPCTKSIFVLNGPDLVYWYGIRSSAEKYSTLYFWVVGKRKDGAVVTATTGPSNVASGWSHGFGDGQLPLEGGVLAYGGSHTFVAGVSKVFLLFFGHGGSGAGASLTRPGGGGGGAAVFSGWISVLPGGKIRVPSGTPPVQTSNGVSAVDSEAIVLQYSADGTFTDTISVFSSGIAGGGQFDAGGDGAGGAGAVASPPHASVQQPKYYSGTNGDPAVSATGRGGRSGRGFGATRTVDAHYKPFPTPDNPGAAVLGAGGGGSGINHTLKGGIGWVSRVVFYTR